MEAGDPYVIIGSPGWERGCQAPIPKHVLLGILKCRQFLFHFSVFFIHFFGSVWL